MTDWHEMSGGCSRANVMLYGKRWDPKTDTFDYSMWFECRFNDSGLPFSDPESWTSDRNGRPAFGWRITHWASMPEPPK